MRTEHHASDSTFYSINKETAPTHIQEKQNNKMKEKRKKKKIHNSVSCLARLTVSHVSLDGTGFIAGFSVLDDHVVPYHTLRSSGFDAFAVLDR